MSWKPSKAARAAYGQKMAEIETFCKAHHIEASLSGDSYYFTLDGVNYRVSNHTVEASNRAAYNVMGEKVREEYHPGGRETGTVYITAGKTRIMDIYNDIAAGYELDSRGYRISR